KNEITFNIEHETPFIEVNAFKKLEGFIHGFSTRLGGVSEDIYKSLNLGFYLGDNRDKVMENYRRLTSAIGIDYKQISCPNQQHHTNVLVVTKEDAGDGITRALTHSDIDAQITNIPGIPLIVYSADCVPIMFADPVKKIIGTAHAGWRGTVAGIAARTVEKMQETYGCNPKDIHAAIGPSIGLNSYEVDDTVINGLKECKYIDMSREFDSSYELYINAEKPGKYMFNLQLTNELILINEGLSKDHIYQTNLCTMEHHDIFFSHRFTNGRRGLNAGMIQMILKN
ncbi:MAG: peptidoglycan editing factor PgeF, partial [Lachnospiraceae bacterium]|nr:peptidoglycan editing factor PgeF [Lachnospiraceae bacterium]